MRRKRVTEARYVVLNWSSLVRATMASGSTVRAIDFDQWSVALLVDLHRARVAEDFTELKNRRLESAFDGTRGSVRVSPGTKAREVTIRFMLSDPHAEPIVPTDDDFTGDELHAKIGTFETGEDVIADFVHTLVAGATGAGKSGIINALIRAMAPKRNVAILGIDMKPGALELGKWGGIMFALARDGLEAKVLLEQVLIGIQRRGAILKERGLRKWIPTPEEPFIVLIVDEVQELKESKLFPQLTRVAALSRAYGFALILATQHPKDKVVPAEVIANCIQRIGLKCEASTAERLIFDDNASREGWRLTTLPGNREGTFLIRSKRYRRPVRARAYWVDDEMVVSEVRRFADHRVSIDSATWLGVSAVIPRELGDSVTDAVLIEDSPDDDVLTAIAAGEGTPARIMDETGIPVRTVNTIIKRLADQGKITQDRARGPWRIVT